MCESINGRFMVGALLWLWRLEIGIIIWFWNVNHQLDYTKPLIDQKVSPSQTQILGGWLHSFHVMRWMDENVMLIKWLKLISGHNQCPLNPSISQHFEDERCSVWWLDMSPSREHVNDGGTSQNNWHAGLLLHFSADDDNDYIICVCCSRHSPRDPISDAL